MTHFLKIVIFNNEDKGYDLDNNLHSKTLFPHPISLPSEGTIILHPVFIALLLPF